MPKDNTKEWAKLVWERNVGSWIKRTEQDYNYRDYLVNPALKVFFKKFKNKIPKGLWIDLGCGEGRETFLLQKTLNAEGLKNPIVGLEPQKKLIDEARVKYHQSGIEFYSQSMGKFVGEDKRKISGISSFFVLQDAPNAKLFLKNISKNLKSGSLFLTVAVHPDFAEALRMKGHIKMYNAKSGNNWDWAGEYPIAEVGRAPFYAPYFQRSISWYTNELKKLGLDLIYLKELMPDGGLIQRGVIKKIPPFYKYSFNVYWPFIVKQPSSFLLVAKKL